MKTKLYNTPEWEPISPITYRVPYNHPTPQQELQNLEARIDNIDKWLSLYPDPTEFVSQQDLLDSQNSQNVQIAIDDAIQNAELVRLENDKADKTSVSQDWFISSDGTEPQLPLDRTDLVNAKKTDKALDIGDVAGVIKIVQGWVLVEDDPTVSSNWVEYDVAGDVNLEDYYTSEEVDAFLLTIANSIDTKADIGESYLKAETYTQEEVDVIVNDVSTLYTQTYRVLIPSGGDITLNDVDAKSVINFSINIGGTENSISTYHILTATSSSILQSPYGVIDSSGTTPIASQRTLVFSTPTTTQLAIQNISDEIFAVSLSTNKQTITNQEDRANGIDPTKVNK